MNDNFDEKRRLSPPCPTVRPLIISASRVTDIPAFHSARLMESLRTGFIIRHNPYNQKPRRVEFSRAKIIVFWTKNPAPLEPHLKEILDVGLTPIFLFTLNNYEPEGWEPHLPPLAERLATFKRLASALPPGAVSWRFDPIVLGRHLGVEQLIKRFGGLAQVLAEHTERVIFSFLTLYPKVVRRLGQAANSPHRPTESEIRAILEALVEMKNRQAWPLTFTSCAEKGDWFNAEINPGSCIGADLALRFHPDLIHSPELFTRSAADLFQPAPTAQPLKDPGQRALCRCLPSQDIGHYGTCGHGCVYCYAAK